MRPDSDLSVEAVTVGTDRHQRRSASEEEKEVSEWPSLS
jgi:hypothetical protein